jgi:NTP pyrophosphatase (non-canonical NTP hydrolase)
MNLTELSNKAHEMAVSKGFYEDKKETGTLLMLIVSELGEALEADRKDQFAYRIDLDDFNEGSAPEEFDISFRNNIKDTFEDEIADTLIRIFDLCGYYEIDIQKHVELKMRYNSTRPNKHGKAY